MNTTKLLLYIVGLLILIIIGGGVLWSISSKNHRAQMIQANNDLAALFPLKHINDSLAVKVVSVQTDLDKAINAKSQLRRIITEKDQKILTLIGARIETRTDTVRVPVRYKDEFYSYFDTTDNWMTIQGFFDTANVVLATVAMKDSLTLAITQAKNEMLYGYIQNHSPYTTVVNANFAIDASQFIDKPSPYWKYAAIAGWTAILIKVGVDFFKR